MAGKNIIVCSDGTGNSTIKGRGTNVFKIFEAIDLNSHRNNPELDPQVAFYDDGVGTEKFKLLKIFAGITGHGLKRNVKQLYKEVVRIYDPGDRLFLFGFSRGAFTVRTLAGLIHTCGILDVKRFPSADKLEAAVSDAYRLYRKSYRTELAKIFRGEPDSSRITQLREENSSQRDVEIRFLGVWDTVDAVGLPFRLSDFINLTVHRFKFPDPKLNACVQHACHALAIDDQRRSFRPLLWDDDPRIEQVWFAGAHSNVGGGYPKQGMSLVTLDWMMSKAEENGLRLLPIDRALFRDRASVDDKLYNPRAGLGVFYRWQPRDIAAICAEHGIRPTLHLSVLERVAHGTNDYAPGNLPPNADVVITPSGFPAQDEAPLQRAKEIETVLRDAHLDGKTPLASMKGSVITGVISYWLFLLTTLTTLGALYAASLPAGDRTAMVYIKSAGSLLGNLVSLQWGAVWPHLKRVLEEPVLPWLLGAGFLLSWALAGSVSRRMTRKYSGFWHLRQPSLRGAMKRARAEAKESQEATSPLRSALG